MVSGGLVLQTLLALGAVLAALWGLALLLRRVGQPRGLPNGANLRVLGAASVGPRERVVLVELAGTWLVVGVAPGNVRALHALPRPPHQDLPRE